MNKTFRRILCKLSDVRMTQPGRAFVWGRAGVFGMFFLLLAFHSLVNAGEAKSLRIVTIAVAPFGMVDGAGHESGIVYDIGNRLAEESGFKTKNSIVPYPRAVAMIESGDADLLISLANPDLKATAIARISFVENVVISRSNDHYQAIEDLHGKSVAAVRGAEYDKRISTDPRIKKYAVNSYEQGLQMLFAGRVDGVVGTKEGIFFSLKAMGVPYTKAGKPLILGRQDAWLHFSNATYDEQTANILREAVLRLQKRNVVPQIEEKYIGRIK